MKRSLSISSVVHVALLAFLYWGLPDLFKPKEEPEMDHVLTVEVLPISEFSNVKPKSTRKPPTPTKPVEKPKTEEPPVKPEEKPEPPKEEVKPEPPVEKPIEEQTVEDIPEEDRPTKPGKAEKAPPKPKVNEQQLPPPVMLNPAQKPDPEKDKAEAEKKKEKAKKTPPKKPKEAPKKAAPADDFDQVLKSVKNIENEQKQQAAEQQPAPDDKTEAVNAKSTGEYNPSIPLSISEKDAIRSQFLKCWTPPIGARDLENMSVTILVQLDKDGTVRNPKIIEGDRAANDSFYRAFADSAMRAVYKCSPLQHLPPAEKYDGDDGWHEMELVFTPQDMF